MVWKKKLNLKSVAHSRFVKVSVIVPVYNAEKYLKDCLKSLTEQTLKEIEIICIDEDSIDSSLSILQEYATLDERVQIIGSRMIKIDETLKGILSCAQGQYVFFVKAEDYFSNDILERMYLRAIKTEADIVACNFDFYFQKTGTFEKTHNSFSDVSDSLEVFIPRYHPKKIFEMSHMFVWNNLYAKTFIKRYENFNKNTLNKNNCFFPLAARAVAKRVAFIQKILLHHRQFDETSAFSGESLQSWQHISLFYENLIDFLKRNRLFDFYRTALYSYMIEELNCLSRTLCEPVLSFWQAFLVQKVLNFFELKKNEENLFLKKLLCQNNDVCLLEEFYWNSKEKIIPIVINAEKRDLFAYFATIESIKYHVNQELFYDIYVLGENIPFNLKYKIESLSEKNVRVKCIDIETKTREYVDKNSFFCSFLEYKKYVYLEIPCAFSKDIKALYFSETTVHNFDGTINPFTPLWWQYARKSPFYESILYQEKNQKVYNEAQIIPIVFITDDNYVIPTSTAITSLILNKLPQTQYDVYVISTCLSKENLEKFSIFNSGKVKINVIQAGLEKYTKFSMPVKNSICSATPSALLKFEIPSFLKNYDKAIYMDGDVLVQKDLSELWNIDIKDFYVAAVCDTGRLYSKSPKFVKYPQYFNSGVMLLNLKMLRSENISEKLYEVRKNSKAISLMDQNVLNEVLKDKVKNIDIAFNFLGVNLRRASEKYDFQAINRLFHSSYKSLEDIERQAYILHFASKDKPWKYYNGEYSEKWFKIFKMSPYKDFCLNRVWKNVSLAEKKKSNKEIIVSLTSYPARIKTIHLTIKSLLDQVFPADKVILWLAPEQFPNKEKDLPKELLDLTDMGLTINWYHDIKSYKKLIPALKLYPDSIVVTADDDALYDKNWLLKLYQSYLKYPHSIHCHRAHKIVFDKTEIKPYKDWIRYNKVDKTYHSYNMFFVGVGGVLYPPHCLSKNVLSEDKFMHLCPQGDDIWFWANAVMNGTKIKRIEDPLLYPKQVDGTQETALWHSNVEGGQNDVQIKNIIKEYPEILKILNKEKKDV